MIFLYSRWRKRLLLENLLKIGIFLHETTFFVMYTFELYFWTPFENLVFLGSKRLKKQGYQWLYFRKLVPPQFDNG